MAIAITRAEDRRHVGSPSSKAATYVELDEVDRVGLAPGLDVHGQHLGHDEAEHDRPQRQLEGPPRAIRLRSRPAMRGARESVITHTGTTSSSVLRNRLLSASPAKTTVSRWRRVNRQLVARRTTQRAPRAARGSGLVTSASERRSDRLLDAAELPPRRCIAPQGVATRARCHGRPTRHHGRPTQHRSSTFEILQDRSVSRSCLAVTAVRDQPEWIEASHLLAYQRLTEGDHTLTGQSITRPHLPWSEHITER